MSHWNNADPVKPPPPRRVLLVEDHPAMREAVAELLETDDRIDVTAAVASAEEALELVSRARAEPSVDLAVVDLNLPGMHGLELVSELDRHAHVPVVVLSSHSSARYESVALEAGARAYVEKIRTATELLETVRRVLGLPERGGRPGHAGAGPDRLGELPHPR